MILYRLQKALHFALVTQFVKLSMSLVTCYFSEGKFRIFQYLDLTSSLKTMFLEFFDPLSVIEGVLISNVLTDPKSKAAAKSHSC